MVNAAKAKHILDYCIQSEQMCQIIEEMEPESEDKFLEEFQSK